jgi:hypothetical protein
VPRQIRMRTEVPCWIGFAAYLCIIAFPCLGPSDRHGLVGISQRILAPIDRSQGRRAMAPFFGLDSGAFLGWAIPPDVAEPYGGGRGRNGVRMRDRSTVSWPVMMVPTVPTIDPPMNRIPVQNRPVLDTPPT